MLGSGSGADQQAIVESLEDCLKEGVKQLVGKRGYRRFFRATKSLLHTCPIFHQWDSTIKGHVFCSFLALVLVDEMKHRLAV